jgi:hypothetical protein
MGKQLTADDFFVNRLRELCADLSFQHSGTPFFLSKIDAARHLDVGTNAAARRLQLLVEFGELEIVEVSDPRRRTATKYRFRPGGA